MTRSTLLAELKQNVPFPTPDQEAAVALLKTADVLRQRVATALEPFGVTVQQYNVLRILRGASPGGLPTLEIGERLIERAPGITRLVDCLEGKGMVTRSRDPEDRRVVRCHITSLGLTRMEEMDGPVLAADRAGMGALSDGEIRTLLRLLERVRATQK